MSDSGNTLPSSASIESLAFVEGLYSEYLNDPASVPDDWRRYFDQNGDDSTQLGPSFSPRSVFDPAPAQFETPSSVRQASQSNGKTSSSSSAALDAAVLQDRVDALVRAYRVRGHMVAKIDPLGLPRPQQPELDPAFYELKPSEMDKVFSSRTIFGAETLTLREIIDRLSTTYCRSIGVQFMHIDDLEVKNWLQERMEGSQNRVKLSREEQLRILAKLTDATIFEDFIQKKYTGAKSFSLEGSESLIPLLAFAIERAALHNVNEIVLGMAHRGRLNVLANILGKSPRNIFREFEDVDPELYMGSGDVKYHIGHSSDYMTASGKRVHLSLCFNPSHLEFVNPVVLGRCRAKQDRQGDDSRSRKLSILIHGDAAFAGEGIVQETLNLSQLKAYQTGGTIHVITNNQIGFTTPPSESRSSTYATDVAKMLQIPIFHVNGEDPEAVAQTVQLAMDFRRTFCRDVVIDMYGYRRHGHNEGDEPSFTQPLLYQAIAQKTGVRDSYAEFLLATGEITREESDQIAVERRDQLEQELSEARRADYVRIHDWLGGVWQGYQGGPESEVTPVSTAVSEDVLQALMKEVTTIPEDFNPHKKVLRLMKQRAEMGSGERPLDWGAAETLAFASLVTQGTRVRLTGQDCGRGTFSHRHAVLHDVKTGRRYMPLAHLDETQAPIEIENSPLSEAGVLGYEYGYSLDWPDGLVIWEAQFGDFVNTAQCIIDQFISSAEDKWKRLSGLVMLLPHGFEGMGPEHSSARIERFLTQVAEDNMQIVQPTTAANYFHMLRRQVLSSWRKPLVVFTPKSLLRLPAATSALSELTDGEFQRVIPDERPEPSQTKKIFLCSGKVYYELMLQREERKRDDVAILRIEQLYPLEKHHLEPFLADYAEGTPIKWVQDEPENMGPWRYISHLLGPQVFDKFPLSVASRPASASPATGSATSHQLEEQRLMDEAFDK
ncbi:MAG: 2-oxoglutarate dehydrogenase E1 component [Polyangiaceae bacterium]|nr:2-oxoglutarate dehydrogenase E1 component [Polyangiaceae bacterium]